MNALWTYGYWQSRERYTNQEEIVDVVRRYRDIKVPLDVIVQDWQYWGHTDPQWNGITWTKEEYPEPERMMREIHSLNAHCIASLWPSFGNGTEVYRDFKSRSYMLGIKTYPEENVDVYDVFNPEARKLYWDYLSRKMFSTGLDGYWLDATEPEMKEDGQACHHPHPFGLSRTTAYRFHLVVGRHRCPLGCDGTPDSCCTQLLAVWQSLLEHRPGWFLGARLRRLHRSSLP